MESASFTDELYEPDVVSGGVLKLCATGQPRKVVHWADGVFGVWVVFPEAVADVESVALVYVCNDVLPVDGEPELGHTFSPLCVWLIF